MRSTTLQLFSTNSLSYRLSFLAFFIASYLQATCSHRILFKLSPNPEYQSGGSGGVTEEKLPVRIKSTFEERFHRISSLDMNRLEDLEDVAKIVDNEPSFLKKLESRSPILASVVRSKLYMPLKEEPIFADFPNEVLEIIYSNIGAIQLENNCKVRCPFCAFSHNDLKSKYKQFGFPLLRSLFSEIAESVNKNDLRERRISSMLYYESDPFDYKAPPFPGSKTTYFYKDVHNLFINNMGYAPHVVTAVPKSRERKIIEFLEADIETPEFRISISAHNRERLSTRDTSGKTFIEEIEKYRKKREEKLLDQFNQMTLKEWLIEFYKMSEKHPSFKYVLDCYWPNGMTNAIFRETLENLRTKTFNPNNFNSETLERITNSILRLNLPIQYFFIYKVPLMSAGRNINNGNRIKTDPGIGCFNGVLITPDKIYNVVQLDPVSNKYPDGQILVPIQPNLPNIKKLPEFASIEDLLRMGVVIKRNILNAKELYNKFVLQTLSGEMKLYSIVVDTDGNYYAKDARE